MNNSIYTYADAVSGKIQRRLKTFEFRGPTRIRAHGCTQTDATQSWQTESHRDRLDEGERLGGLDIGSIDFIWLPGPCRVSFLNSLGEPLLDPRLHASVIHALYISSWAKALPDIADTCTVKDNRRRS